MRFELFVADAIEPLASGKLAVLGLFPDRQVILNVPEGFPVATEEQPFGVALTLCVVLSGMSIGEHVLAIRIEDPLGRQIPGSEPKTRRVTVSAGQSSTSSLLRLDPLLATCLGAFTVYCVVDGEEFKDEFMVLERRIPA